VLGFRALSNVVVANATHSLYIKGNAVSEKLWNHSLGVALATRILHGRAGSRDRDHAFLAGLMHDVGEMILVHGDSRGFASLVHEAEASQCDLVGKEQKEYGFDHTQVGVTLLEAWNIDTQIREAVLNHHNYDAAKHDPKALAASLVCADYLAAKADLGFYYRPPLPDPQVMSVFDCENEEKISEVVEQIRAAYEEESALFRPA
jgi:putative nucleotidyltransferase with HDIG domain